MVVQFAFPSSSEVIGVHGLGQPVASAPQFRPTV